MITAVDARMYSALRTAGATPIEAAIVLSVAREVDEVIELAEQRGARGRFVSGNGGGGTSVKDIRRIQAMRQKAHDTASATAKRDAAAKRAANTDGTPKAAAPAASSPAAAVPSPPKAVESLVSGIKTPADMAAEHAAYIQQVADTLATNHAQQVLAQVHPIVKKATDDLQAAQDADDKRDHRRALAAHVGIIASGGVLAYFEAKMGAPATIQAVSALAPNVVQELVDWYKDL